MFKKNKNDEFKKIDPSLDYFVRLLERTSPKSIIKSRLIQLPFVLLLAACLFYFVTHNFSNKAIVISLMVGSVVFFLLVFLLVKDIVVSTVDVLMFERRKRKSSFARFMSQNTKTRY